MYKKSLLLILLINSLSPIIASNNSNDEQTSKKPKTSHEFTRNNNLEDSCVDDTASTHVPGLGIEIDEQIQQPKPIKHPLQIAWNEKIAWNENNTKKDEPGFNKPGFNISSTDDKKFEVTYEDKKYSFTSKKGIKSLPYELSQEILSYLCDFNTDTSCKEVQNANIALENSCKNVNGTRFINSLQQLRLYDKIQSLQKPDLPAKPHSIHLNNPRLFELLCNSKSLMHQSKKDNIPNFKSSLAATSYKIYETDDQKRSHYKTRFWMMGILLKNGVDSNSYVQRTAKLNESNKHMLTPLCFAATYNTDISDKHDAIAGEFSRDATNLLLQHGANPNKKSYTLNERLATPKQLYQTPLHYAAEKNNEEVVQALVTHRSNKINVNIKESSGNTALHFATKMNNPRMVKSLLDAGAQRDIENKDKEIPLHLVPKISNIGYYQTRDLQELDIVHEKAIGITRLLLEKDANKQKTALNHCNNTPVDIARQCAERTPNKPECHDVDQRKISFQKILIDIMSPRP